MPPQRDIYDVKVGDKLTPEELRRAAGGGQQEPNTKDEEVVIAQETEIDKEISPLQQLISEIEKGIDIEKRFDFSRANT